MKRLQLAELSDATGWYWLMMEPFRRIPYHAYLVPFLCSSLAGFLLPYWIYYGLLTLGENFSGSLRAVRSIRNASTPQLSNTLDIRHVDILHKAYYVDSDVMYSSVGEKAEKFIFIEVITPDPRSSYTPPFIEDKNTRHIYLPSRGNINDGVRHVFRTICQRKSRDWYSWTAVERMSTRICYITSFQGFPRLFPF